MLMFVRTLVLTLLGSMLNTGNAGDMNRLEYQNRGDYYEGVRATPAAGLTIELLSAKAIHNEPASTETLPPRYRLRFYLKKDTLPVSVVVQDVAGKTGYVLDKVKPARPWGTGFDNVFEWSTHDVIAHIPGLEDLNRLGVVVRLGRATPSGHEEIAPALLYYRSDPPASITSYEFAFKTTTTARLAINVERTDGAEVAVQPTPKAVPQWLGGDIPLRVTWDAANAAPGEYRLVVRGQSLQNAERFEERVTFYHEPILRSPHVTP